MRSTKHAKASINKAGRKKRQTIPLGASEAPLRYGHPVVVSRTLLHVEEPSDLRSLPTSDAVTVSTSAAHAFRNPRAA